MSTRYLITAALLFASACGAHADVLATSASTAQSGFLSGWTSGNGTDVVSSGVLSSGTTLVGGVAYGSGNLAESLYQKASASNSSGQVTLSYSDGIEGSYLLSTSNAKVAAMLGNGAAVVSGNGGKVVTTGGTGSTGGSSAAVGSSDSSAAAGSSAGSGSTGSSGATGSAGASDSAGSSSGSGSTGSVVTLPPSVGSGSDVGTGGTGGTSLDVPVTAADPAADPAAVPEPSTIALLAAGMFGVLAMGRRRMR